ncbi:MAG: Rossmann-like domain-containing protein [Thermacetogeniaceae bacterium]|jgi:uncharacterized protein (DUF4213/DUF364 family)|nr:DUF364 domain-containing protein [Thermoanaerobacterales bacterium]
MLQKVYENALPRLIGKKVRDFCIGKKLVAVELDDGGIGVAYNLNEIECGVQSLPEAGEIVGRDAQEIASFLLKDNPQYRAVGVAVSNAAADYDSLSTKALDAADVFDARPSDVVGMIGNIKPIAQQLEPRVSRLIIFDRGNPEGVYPEEQQEELLPQCDLVVLTSSSLLNDTFFRVISYCLKAREIVLTGATTPLYPQAFKGTGVTVLAGCRWFPQHKEEIFASIRQGACLRRTIQYGEKLTVQL